MSWWVKWVVVVAHVARPNDLFGDPLARHLVPSGTLLCARGHTHITSYTDININRNIYIYI